MIDVGDAPGNNELFLDNLQKCLYAQDRPHISDIFLSHSNPNHMGGLVDVLELLKSIGQDELPNVNKRLGGFDSEHVLKTHLGSAIQDIKHG